MTRFKKIRRYTSSSGKSKEYLVTVKNQDIKKTRWDVAIQGFKPVTNRYVDQFFKKCASDDGAFEAAAKVLDKRHGGILGEWVEVEK